MKEEDLKTLLHFYEKKLLTASSADEEEAIVKGFGDPLEVTARIREEYARLNQKPLEDPPKPAEQACENRPADKVPSAPKAQPDPDEDDVKIFSQSKPTPTHKNTGTKPQPAASAKNGRESKKAEPEQKMTKPTPQAKTHYGLINRLLDRMQAKGEAKKYLKLVLSVLLAPIFLLLSLGLVLLYLGALTAVVLIAGVLVLCDLVLILISIVELIYAIFMFFTSVPVALIELGLGTVLIGIVTAITALVYQVLTGVLVYALKKITALSTKAFRYVRDVFLGTKGERS